MVLVGTSFTLLAQTQMGTNHSQSTDGVEVPPSEVAEHLIAGHQLIHSATSSDGVGSYVWLKIVATPSGTVLSATPVSEASEFSERATSLAMRWQFRPFLRSGSPVYAGFLSSVLIVPPERRPRERTPFPETKDWDTLQMTLERAGACIGGCPVYRLIVFGNGKVAYEGHGFVEYCGEHRGHIPQESVRKLVDLFRQADFFNLFDQYVFHAADENSFTTSITLGGKTKSVDDSRGELVGMPEAVSDVENSIDQLAGPKVWAKDSDTNLECKQAFVPTTTSRIPAKIQ